MWPGKWKTQKVLCHPGAHWCGPGSGRRTAGNEEEQTLQKDQRRDMDREGVHVMDESISCSQAEDPAGHTASNNTDSRLGELRLDESGKHRRKYDALVAELIVCSP